jgi:polyhydroxybutyrate depolymerase
MMPRLALPALLALALLSSGARVQGAGTREETVVVDGSARAFLLHLPPDSAGPRPLPLVVLLHGLGGSAARMESYTGMSALADRERFAVAYAQGLGAPANWNVWRPGAPDDVAYVRALIDRARQVARIDSRRIFVAGHSNGGLMAYRVGAELGDRVAAIGVVAGSIGWRADAGEQAVVRGPTRPVSAIIVHGTADDIVPFDDTIPRPAAYRRAIPAPESAAYWARSLGCAAPPERETPSGGIVRLERHRCPRGAAVELHAIVGGGHGWPAAGADGGGAAPAATPLLWEFFARHPRR